MSRYLLLMTILLCAGQMGCSRSADAPANVADPNINYGPYSHEAINYFSEVAFGAEFGNSQGLNFIVKWGRGMRVYISNANQDDIAEARRIVDELAALTGLSIDFTDQPLTGNNFPHDTIHIVYTTQDAFNRLCGLNRYQSVVVQTHGEQKGFFCNDWNERYIITRANILIDNSIQSQDQRNHLLREELTQSFGIMKDSYAYTDSIFHADYGYTPTEYSELDKQVIRILYDRKLSPGMTLEQVLQELQQ